MKQFIRDNTMEILELGQSTAKATKQGIKNTFSPLKILQSMTQNPNAVEGNKKDGEHDSEGKMKEALEKNKKNSTPLDYDKLGDTYKDKDKQSLEAMRNKLFNLVKSDEQHGIDLRKREEQERVQKMQQEEEEKRRREEQQRQQDSQSAVPQGKARKTIGGAQKKKADESHQEVKANRSKG